MMQNIALIMLVLVVGSSIMYFCMDKISRSGKYPVIPIAEMVPRGFVDIDCNSRFINTDNMILLACDVELPNPRLAMSIPNLHEYSFLYKDKIEDYYYEVVAHVRKGIREEPWMLELSKQEAFRLYKEFNHKVSDFI